jgi:hypothetical protein
VHQRRRFGRDEDIFFSRRIMPCTAASWHTLLLFFSPHNLGKDLARNLFVDNDAMKCALNTQHDDLSRSQLFSNVVGAETRCKYLTSARFGFSLVKR